MSPWTSFKSSGGGAIIDCLKILVYMVVWKVIVYIRNWTSKDGGFDNLYYLPASELTLLLEDCGEKVRRQISLC
jgi:hypothetical protein